MDAASIDDPGAIPVAEAVSAAEPRRARSLGPLRMIGKAALVYPSRVVTAALALLVTASATLAIPNGFKLVIDIAKPPLSQPLSR